MNTSRKLTAIVLSLVLLFVSVPFSVGAGDAVPEGYTPIYDIEELSAVRNRLDGNYILMTDIDMTEATAEGGDWDDNGHGWKPIGENSNAPFAGVFDGNGHTITGMRIKNTPTAYAGLFGYATGEIRGVTLEDVSISVSLNVKDVYVGAVAGYTSGSVNDCIVSGSVSSQTSTDYYGLLSSSTSAPDTSLFPHVYTGGVCGYIANGSVTNCHSFCDVISGVSNKRTYDTSGNYVYSCSYSFSGGVCGYLTGGSVTGCSSVGSVTSAANSSATNNSNSNQTVCKPYSYSGGVCGYVRNGSVLKCYNTGAVAADAVVSSTKGAKTPYSYSGGVCGYTSSGTTENCYNTGTVASTSSIDSYSYAGGVCGYMESSSNVTSSLNLGSVTNGSYKYAIAYNSSGTVRSCYYLRGTASRGYFSAVDSESTAVALTESQMKLESSFKYLDFDEVWFLENVEACGHPRLKACIEPTARFIDVDVNEGKTTYFQNEEIDIENCYLTCTYNEIDDVTVIPITLDMLSGYDMSVIGEQEVTVSYMGLTTSFYITVEPIVVVSLTPNVTSFTIDKGASRQITVTVDPADATYQDLTWTSADETIATVDANGTVTGVGAGTTTITGYNVEGAEAAVTVTVFEAAESIVFAQTSYTVEKSATFKPTFTVTPATSNDTYTYTSTNTKIFTVDTDGTIRPVAVGSATLRVSSSRGVVATCSIKVENHVQSITPAKTEIALRVYETAPLDTVVFPADLTNTVVWTCSNENVAYIVGDSIKAVGEGEAVFTATADGVTATITVTVSAHEHTFGEWTVKTQPTCVDTGLRERVCASCKAKETETIAIDPARHTGVTKLVGAVTQTCTRDGYTGDTYCVDCGAQLRKGYAQPAPGHNFGDWVRVSEPTCVAEGQKTRTCSVCRTKETVTLPKDPDLHTGRTTLRNAVAVSCSDDGYTGDVYCADCEKLLRTGDAIASTGHSFGSWTRFDDTYHQRVCANDRTHVEKGYHLWDDGVVTTTPTTTRTGVMTYTCATCGATYRESIAKLVSESEAAKLTVKAPKAFIGKPFTVQIVMSDAWPVSYIRAQLEYDKSVFTLDSVTSETAFDSFDNGVNLVWSSATDVTQNGVLVTLNFTVAADAKPGNYTIALKCNEIYNSAEQNITVYTYNANVPVKPVLIGDANDDGVVDGRDLVRIRKYLAEFNDETGTSTVEIFPGAEVTGDGVVDGSDVVRLRKYFAEYDDATGTSSVKLGAEA